MKKIVALLLTAIMVLGCVPGLAENTKHERVYVVAAADGTVKSVTDNIHLENADGLDEIMDQTILTDIQNVGGKENFTLDGETLTWKANGEDIALSLSIGAAMFNGHPDYERLIQIADEALYIAKRRGRNRVELWKASL